MSNGPATGSPYPSAAYVAPTIPSAHPGPGSGPGPGPELSAYQRARTVPGHAPASSLGEAQGSGLGPGGAEGPAQAQGSGPAHEGDFGHAYPRSRPTWTDRRYDAQRPSPSRTQPAPPIPSTSQPAAQPPVPSAPQSQAAPVAAPEKPKAPPRKRKKPAAAPAYDGPDYYASSTQAGVGGGGSGSGAPRAPPGVRKDSLGRVMNSASHSQAYHAQVATAQSHAHVHPGGAAGSRRAGSVLSSGVRGGGDDASVGSGAKGTAEPVGLHVGRGIG